VSSVEKLAGGVEEIVSFYLSKAMFSLFLRCFSSGVDSLSERMQSFLGRCLTAGPLPFSVPHDEDPGVYRQLVRSGVLEETEDGQTKFTSPATSTISYSLVAQRRREAISGSAVCLS